MCVQFQRTVAERADDVALRTKGGLTSITWREYGARVRALAAGLAGLGVRPGDAVAILLTNRPEFNLVDTAAMHLGAVPFSIYQTSSPEQIQYVVGDAGAKVAVVESAFLEVFSKARAELGWKAQVSFEELVRLMVDHDLEALASGVPEKQAG